MASKGTSTFIFQRLTAVLLLPLTLWFLFNVVAHAGASFSATTGWLSAPINAILLGIFITTGALHMRIGMMEIIEDYIHGGLNGTLNLINWVVVIAIIAVTWWSLFSLAF